MGIQDLGGAGLVCATSETAARGGVGMDVDVTAVPLREPAMQPYEIMTSESQERMLAIVTPENWPAVAALCAQVGGPRDGRRPRGRARRPTRTATPVGMLRVRHGFDGEILAEVPATSLADEAPLYDRPRQRPANLDAVRADDPTDDEPVGSPSEDLLGLLVDPAWVYRQYDSQLFLNTVVGPGRDAALLRLAGPGLPISERGIALSTDSNPRWCALDPRTGTALTVAESVANLACVGATAKAVVNCLNFGNPEHPEVMWQLSEAIDGMAEACEGLGLPVIGGNVSLYNESGGNDIDPTPVVGLLGVVDSSIAPPPGWAWREGDTVVLVGARRAAGDQPFPLGELAGRRGAAGVAAACPPSTPPPSPRPPPSSRGRSPPSAPDGPVTSRPCTTSVEAGSPRRWPRWSPSPASVPTSPSWRATASCSVSSPVASSWRPMTPARSWTAPRPPAWRS